MSEALATTETNLPAFPPTGGMEGFGDEAIKPPEMTIVQPTSHNTEATPGTFRDSITGDEYKEIRVVPIKYWHGRVLFPPQFSTDSRPICRSYDMVHPAQGDGLNPQSPLCATCDFGPKSWAKGAPPPACKETLRWLFIDKETELPFYLTAKGKNLSPCKRIIQALHRYADASRHKGEPRSLYDFAFTIALKFEQNQKGKFYVLECKNPKKLEHIGRYAELYRALTAKPTFEAGAEDAPIQEAITEAINEEVVPF